MARDYQAIVIGAGPGGYPCGIRLGQLGIKTLVVERQYWGGVCLNVGCIPSKALITAGKRLEEIAHADAMGIIVTGEAHADMTKLQAWKNGITAKLSGGVKTLLKGNKTEMMDGSALIVGPNEVEITAPDGTKKRLTADNIVIATGSTPIEIPGFAYKDEPVLDSTKALDLKFIPKHLVCIGGGYIGLELAMAYAKLGSKVTVVEMLDSVLFGFDPDCVKAVQRNLKKAGVDVMVKAKAKGWAKTADGIVVNVEHDGADKAIAADVVLVAVGRRPNSKGLGLEALGVQMNGAFVKVDKQLRTSVPSIFAIGDVAGQPMLAHKATHEGEVVAEVIAGHKVSYDAKTVPAVVFTDPEIAIAGLDEAQARARGPIKVGKVPYGAVGRALTTNETDGFFKVVIDEKTKVVLGVTICGSHASDLISECALAIEMGAEALDIGLTIHPHPTLGEGVMEAAKAALGEAVHILNR